MAQQSLPPPVAMAGTIAQPTIIPSSAATSATSSNINPAPSSTTSLVQNQPVIPPRPPASQLLGHENLFNYFELTRWSKSHLKSPLSIYYDSILRDAHLPLVSGPVTIDGVPFDRDPNSSLVTYAYQAAPPPLQARALSSRHRSLLELTGQPSKSNSNPGPLEGCRHKLATLIDTRAQLLQLEEKAQKKEKKRRKKEEQARLEAAAAAAAAVPNPSADINIATSTAEGDNRLTLSLPLAGKKRKAEDDIGMTTADGTEEKKKVRHSAQIHTCALH